MGPGSENIMSRHQQYQYQYLPTAVMIKDNKKPTGKGNPTGVFYNQDIMYAYSSGKVNSQPSTKTARKSNTSPQQLHARSKPIAVKRSVSQSETVCYQVNVGNKATPKQNYYGGKQQHSARNSPVKGLPLASTPRQMSLTPPNMYSQSMNSPIQQNATPTTKLYAGAKFESHPSRMVLPTPPSHWTGPIQRSQSQPTSPTLKSMQKGTGIDMASLFGSPIAKSFPGERMMQALVMAEEMKQRSLESSDVSSESSDEELKSIITEEPKKAVGLNMISGKKSIATEEPEKVVAKKETTPVDSFELKKKLGRNRTSGKTATSNFDGILNLTCHEALIQEKNYKKMSDQLKSLIKIAA